MLNFLKSVFTKPPTVILHHLEFGLLTRDTNLWSGEILLNGATIRFSIHGTGTAPDSTLLNQLRSILDRVNAFQEAALQFISDQAQALNMTKFTLYSIDLFLPCKPDSFVMVFDLEGDAFGIWRVEFVNEQPKFVSRDD